MNKCGIATNEIYAHRASRFVDGVGKVNQVAACTFRNHRHGCDRNPLVGDPDAEFLSDLVNSFYQPIGEAMDFFNCAFGSARD